MVSTRHHPRPFPEPATPSAAIRSNASDSPSKSPSPLHSDDSITVSSSASRKRRSNRSSNAKLSTSSTHLYSHTVPPLLLMWLFVSLPLVVWDTGYIALRPHSMPGGKFHTPVWSLYALYGTVDYVYGWPAWDGHVGFTAAQASLNVVETVMYVYYLSTVLSNSTEGLLNCRTLWGFFLGETDKSVSGPGVATAVVVLFSAAVMTLSKTVLYWLNEYFSNFANIGHNSMNNLVFLWIIPNGLWLIFPAYMIYMLGKEMVAGMEGTRAKKEE
ncbi:uncharacterized protein A1O5_06234 [Cladophialophora psammophila CBS 110553]|uniref:EXPERA domain-containing protein n=1 Tax=Cladophialophora psammophila CBS 110553 TaxID=1182543 RepID=W9WZQ9_9EURO|nr:uncharacterized protein A1O5_06234 [Cladophialophora psammophila CBS 110553]EXJ70166.1 hypothetical protein A1O5_06234 [Cladophialophora psammophila CBS 110553]